MAERMTPQRARELFAYDPETGIVTNRVTRGSKAPAGKAAGCLEKESGYWKVMVDGKPYYLHRLAWAIAVGEWPAKDIDHINNDDRSDNRWRNLRLASASENIRNSRRRKDNRSGVKGVYWDGRRRCWSAEVTLNRKKHFLGYYPTLSRAAAARRAGAERLHGEFARHA